MLEPWRQVRQVIDQVSQAHLPSYYIGGRHAELALAATIFIAVVMVFMKYFGLCSRLHTARRELMACTYQLLLYRRQRRVVMRTQVRTLWCNAKYLLLLMPTILFASVLYLLLHDALANRYAFAPASVGTPFVLRLTPLDDRYDLADVDVRSTGTALPVTAQAERFAILAAETIERLKENVGLLGRFPTLETLAVAAFEAGHEEEAIRFLMMAAEEVRFAIMPAQDVEEVGLVYAPCSIAVSVAIVWLQVVAVIRPVLGIGHVVEVGFELVNHSLEVAIDRVDRAGDVLQQAILLAWCGCLVCHCGGTTSRGFINLVAVLLLPSGGDIR